MSTLSTANITSKAANTPPVIKDLNGTECGQFVRAWINLKGDGTTAIRDSFNISSLTDNGTGDYTIAFTTSFSDTNYCVVIGGYNTNNSDGSWSSVGSSTTDAYPAGVTTGSVRLNTYNSSGSPQDQQAVSVAVFGA